MGVEAPGEKKKYNNLRGKKVKIASLRNSTWREVHMNFALS